MSNKPNKTIWIIADPHFLHARLVKYCKRPVDFTNKVFQGLCKIPEKDILICLGDISMGREKEIYEKFIKPIKCRKILVKGNHDHKTNNWYLNHGWDFVCYGFYDNYRGKKVLFSHYPKPADDYDFNIFGHMHNNVNSWDNVSEEFKLFICNKHLLLCLEELHYQPVKLDYVIDKADKFRLINRFKENK